MKRIAYLSADFLVLEEPGSEADLHEHRTQLAVLREACMARGLELTCLAWSDPAVLSQEFDASILGTTWDYHLRTKEFLERLEILAQRGPLFNPLKILRWNLEKTYLADLVERGAPVVPTLFRESADSAVLERAAAELDSEEIVIKALIGGGAWRQGRWKRGTPVPDAAALPPAGCLIQPFLRAAEDEGEFSFIYIDRAFSHCTRKTARPGDYRVQATFGGCEQSHDPTREELQLAASVLDAVPADLLYARVDMMRLPSGELALMELELLEPYLYPEQGPGLGPAYAAALDRVL